MSRIDPECFFQPALSDELVCTGCVDDHDLKRFIRTEGRGRGCAYCRGRKSPSVPLEELAEFIEGRMETFFGRAVDQLPYESREGGYQGWHTDTEDLLFETIGLELPKDVDGRLRRAIVDAIGDDAWCEFDWLRPELDEGLRYDWDRFCETVKHRRRFFFHHFGGEDYRDPDARSLHDFLLDFGRLIDEIRLIRTQPPGYVLYRARARKPGARFTTARELGPPPAALATQSNRMNPPGIAMFYGAESRALACAEARQPLLSVGRFETRRTIRLLDLVSLPQVPGFFSEASRRERLGLRFLHAFAEKITRPVQGDDRTHVDYIPTQVFTEFLRDFSFEAGAIDGIRYRSATRVAGANVVLFATQEDVFDGSATDTTKASFRRPWLRLASVRHIEVVNQETPAVATRHEV